MLRTAAMIIAAVLLTAGTLLAPSAQADPQVVRYETLGAGSSFDVVLNGQPTLEVAELPPRGKSRDQATAWADVSPRTIQNAASVRAADPELFEQIKQGRIPADRAARQVLQRQRDMRLDSPPP